MENKKSQAICTCLRRCSALTLMEIFFDNALTHHAGCTFQMSRKVFVAELLHSFTSACHKIEILLIPWSKCCQGLAFCAITWHLTFLQLCSWHNFYFEEETNWVFNQKGKPFWLLYFPFKYRKHSLFIGFLVIKNCVLNNSKLFYTDAGHAACASLEMTNF